MNSNTLWSNPAHSHIFVFLLLIAWIIVWKGLALWKAGTKRDKGWFIALLLLNTFGILDIIYVYFISNRKKLKERNAVESK
jgi:hypothetical protein